MLTTTKTSNPHQAVEQSPRQHEPREAAHETARPKLPSIAEEALRVERGATLGDGVGRNLERVDEKGGNDGKSDVEEETAVGLEAEDARCDAEEGCC